MDYDSLFTFLQGALRSVQKTISTQFIDMDKDNEDDVEDIIKAVDSVVKDPNLQIHDFRRIHLFLVLNTDFPGVDLAEEDEDYCHLIGCLPKMSTYVYFKLMHHYSWFNFMGEAIVQCPEAIALDILKCIGRYMEEVDVNNMIAFLRSLYDALFQKVVTLDDSDSINKKFKFVNVLQKLLAFDVKSVLDKLDMSLEQEHHFHGHLVRMMLSLLDTCCLRYNGGCIVIKHDIYNMKIDFDYTQWECVKNKEVDLRNYSLGLMVSKCKKLAMMISIDMFVSWCDVELEGGEKTLQMGVREAAYICREHLKALDAALLPELPALISTLSNIALKPRSEEDSIKEADMETILLRLMDPASSVEKWLEALVVRPETWTNGAYLGALRQHLHSLTPALVYSAVEGAVAAIKGNSAFDLDAVRSIVLDAVRCLPLQDQLALLDKFYRNNGTNNILERPGLAEAITQVLNKLVDQPEKKERLFPDVISAGIQNGQNVVKRLLENSLSSKHRCNTAVALLKEVLPLSVVTLPQNSSVRVTTFVIVHMVNNIGSLLPKEKDHLIYLISALSKDELINASDFLDNHVMKLFETSLSEKNWDDMLFWLDLLYAFSDGSCGDSAVMKPVVVLAFLVQVLEKCRLGPKVYTPLSGVTCEKSITLVYSLVNKLKQTKSQEDSELLWLRGSAGSCSALSWYHLRSLWQHWGHPLPSQKDPLLRWTLPSFGFTSLDSMSPNDRCALVVQLSKVLPLLTVSEWQMMCVEENTIEGAICLFNIIVDVMLVLTQVPTMVKNIAALSNSASNFFNLVKSRTVPVASGMPQASVMDLVDMILLVVAELPEEVVKVRSSQVLTVLQDLLPHALDSTDGAANTHLMETLSAIKEPTVKAGLESIIQQMS